MYANVATIKLPIFPNGIKYPGPGNLPEMPFPQFSSTKGSLCNCTMSAFIHLCIGEQMVHCLSAVALCSIFRELLVNSACTLSSALEVQKMII